MGITLDMADVKPSVLNWIVVTLLAMTGIVFFKWAMARWPVPGLADFVNAA